MENKYSPELFFLQDDDISKAEEDSEAAQDLTVPAGEAKQHNLGRADAKQNTFAAVHSNHDDLKSERVDRVSAELKQHINNLGLNVARQNTFAAVQGDHEDLKQPERMEQEEEEEEEEEEEMPEDLTERRPPSLKTYQFAAEVPRRPDEEESIAE